MLMRMQTSVFAAISLTIISLLLGACDGTDVETPAATAFVHGRLIDGTGAPAVEDATVVVRGTLIESAGPSSSVPIPEGAEVVDIHGQTILPGIISGHVHNSAKGDNLARWARSGVTTVRDAFVPLPDEALVLGIKPSDTTARVVASGSMLTVEGGYPTVPWGLAAINVKGPDDARNQTLALLDRGARFIKIAVESGGFMSNMPGAPPAPWPTLSDEEIAVIVSTAHERGVRVAAHLTVSGDLARVVAAGVDDVMHMVADPLSEELLQATVARGIRWTPTLELWAGFAQMAGPELLLGVEDNTRRFFQAGGRVVLGNDYDGAEVPFDQGMPIHEMLFMKDAGMSPAQILFAATGAAAEACEAKGAYGTLTANAEADLLIVPGNPLQDLNVLTSPTHVMRAGRSLVP